MNSRKYITIITMILMIFSCTHSYAIVLPDGTDLAEGIVAKIDYENLSIMINTKLYYFKDGSVMGSFLKKNKISEDEKVLVFYKQNKGKKLIVNIERDKRETLY